MHVLVVPSERYVPKDDPLKGIFQRDQARALRKGGVRVGVISPQLRSLRMFRKGWMETPGGYKVEDDQGIPVFTYHSWDWIPYLRYGKRWLWLRVGMALFKKYVSQEGNPDLIHTHNAESAGILAFRIKRLWNIPYVLTEHSSAYARKGIHALEIPAIREAYRGAEHRLVVSPHLGHILQEVIGDSVCPWEWVPNVLDDLFERGGYTRPNRAEQEGPFLFLHVGALIEVKGQENLLYAFAEQFRGEREVRLRIGGDGPLRKKLEALAKELGIADQITFLGELRREQVLTEMQACSAYVHASHHETFGVTLIEALSCGKPVISTTCGGPESIVQNTDGILVPPNDFKTLGKAMATVRENRGRYEAASIRKDCIARFGRDALVNHLSDIYQRVMSSRSNRAVAPIPQADTFNGKNGGRV